MTLVIYNTLKRAKEDFIPLDPSHVGLYTCGPTVYDSAHIGNARPVVVFDVLYRLLKTIYPRVTWVRNITDIDDKIMNAAAANGESISDLTIRTTAKYHADMGALGALSPDIEPRATDHVPQMIEMIETLIAKGHAYESQGHVLFSVKSLASYGELSRCNHDEMIQGARVEVAPYKRDAEDFILWKPSLTDGIQPGWDSPWGFGRPGWHIECSAMSREYLGDSFDIHGGGQDLIFPHHENEIAQSKGACEGSDFARYWMHNGMLTVGGHKMSKSLGNFTTVDQLLGTYPGEVIRWVLLSSHYRQPLDWNESVADQARASLDRLYGTLRGRNVIPGEILEDVRLALLDDLNTPLAFAALHECASQINKATTDADKDRLASILKASGSLMGVLQADPESWFQGGDLSVDEAEINTLIQNRLEARASKNFAEADRIRDLLLSKGISLEDGPSGTTWKASV